MTKASALISQIMQIDHAQVQYLCHTEVRQIKGSAASTLQLYVGTWQMFVAELSVGSAPVLFVGRGGHGRIQHQPGLAWVCWWGQVTEEEVHFPLPQTTMVNPQNRHDI